MAKNKNIKKDKKKSKEFSGYKRKVHINKKEWSYLVGRDGVSIINPDKNKKYYISRYEIFKDYYEISPQKVKDYIYGEIINKKYKKKLLIEKI